MPTEADAYLWLSPFDSVFKTHQDRLVKELAYHGTTMEAANRYLE